MISLFLISKKNPISISSLFLKSYFDRIKFKLNYRMNIINRIWFVYFIIIYHLNIYKFKYMICNNINNIIINNINNKYIININNKYIINNKYKNIYIEYAYK